MKWAQKQYKSTKALCSWHWFYVVEKSYTKIKKIITKNLTCTVSVKVRLSTVEF